MRKKDRRYIQVTPQVLVDDFLGRGINVVLLKGYHDLKLDGVRVLTENPEWDAGKLYVCRREDIGRLDIRKAGITYMIQGRLADGEGSGECTYICVESAEDFSCFLNEIQEVFSRYGRLREEMMGIAADEGGVDDVCALAAAHFRNPVFIHDEHFNILASQNNASQLFHFDYNQSTDSFTENIDVINQFRTDRHYKETLKTRGGHIYTSEYSDGDALYANMWEDGLYRGRIVVAQHDTAIQPSYLSDITYFAELVQDIMKKQNIRNHDTRQRLEEIFTEMLEGVPADESRLADSIQKLGWDMGDQYMAGCIELSDEETTRLSVKAICNDIERKISGVFAFFFRDKISFFLNLSAADTGEEGFRAKMSYIIREGLLKVGVSNLFSDLSQGGLYYQQAETALAYGRACRPTDWYHEFHTYLLSYWVKEGLGRFGKNLMTAPAIRLLRQYDREHDTDLCLTLQTYLDCERNSTLTAQMLNVHRSTFHYRLKRIEELTGLNLDDKETRFYLMLSFYCDSLPPDRRP